MLFKYDDRYKLKYSDFLDDYLMSLAFIETLQVGKYVVYALSTSIDKSKNKIFRKSYSEFLERIKIGFNTFLDVKQKSTYIDGKSEFFTSEYLGYGYNEKFGQMDTTGSASGLSSKKLMEKSLLELIEKNELMLFWYKFKGYKLCIDKELQLMIDRMSFKSNRIEVFTCKNLSNAICVIVVAFNDDKISATGVSANLDFMVAFLDALLEAKTMDILYFENCYSWYMNYNDEKCNRINNYIEKIKTNIETKKTSDSFFSKNNDVLKLEDWIDDIRYSVLNTNKFQKHLTIKCLSEKLINCVPVYDNLISMKDKYIIDKYKILQEEDDFVDCCIM